MNRFFVPDWFNESSMTPTERMIFCHICNRAGRRGVCFESFAKMAKVLNLNRKTVVIGIAGIIQKKFAVRRSVLGTTSSLYPFPFGEQTEFAMVDDLARKTDRVNYKHVSRNLTRKTDHPIPEPDPKNGPHNCLTVTLSSLTAERARARGSSPNVNGSAVQRFSSNRQERDFLERFREATSESEMANWGGRWRNRYRADPDKAQRVIAELESMHKEGRIHSNAGACANDLWDRFASNAIRDEKRARVQV